MSNNQQLTAEEHLNKYFEDGNNYIWPKEVIKAMQDYALQVGEAVRQECSHVASICCRGHLFMPPAEKRVLSIDINQFIK